MCRRQEHGRCGLPAGGKPPALMSSMCQCYIRLTMTSTPCLAKLSRPLSCYAASSNIAESVWSTSSGALPMSAQAAL